MNPKPFDRFAIKDQSLKVSTYLPNYATCVGPRNLYMGCEGEGEGCEDL